MTPITLKLTVEEINGILQVLGKVPYEQSYALIQNIQQQAQACMQPKEEPDDQSK